MSEIVPEMAEPEVAMTAALRLLETADESTAVRALDSLEIAVSTNRIARDAIRRCRTLMTGGGDFQELEVTDAAQLASMLLPVGTMSADGSTVLGREGYLYLTEGSNYVLSRYARDQPFTVELAAQWCELFEARARRQRDHGRLFMQFIVPEKISAVPELLPFELSTPTELLALIEHHFRTEGWSARTVPALDLFRLAGVRCIPRLDSHQSGYGSYAIANHVANSFGYRGLYGLPFTKSAVRTGDLAYRFFGTPIYEVVSLPDLTEYPMLAVDPEAVETYYPSDGNTGTRCVWRNPSAPIKLRVAAFGNSCLERGGFPLLSWWFARLFQEFHFVWTNIVDDAYADRIRADLVIGQTMERFLFVAAVPEA